MPFASHVCSQGEALSCSQLATSALTGAHVSADPMTAPTLLNCGSMMLRGFLAQVVALRSGMLALLQGRIKTYLTLFQ
eukprot:scaffold51278_cov13-Tisochrysis_lutea.AAC.1